MALASSSRFGLGNFVLLVFAWFGIRVLNGVGRPLLLTLYTHVGFGAKGKWEG